MNVDRLIDRYFDRDVSNVSIEVFDDINIYLVYSDIVKILNDYPEIELTVLQGMAYCFYEILDNVLTHSGKKMGTVILQYDAAKTRVKILVADDGIGIKASLSANPCYKDINEDEALRLCVDNSVTDGKGMGYGLFSTMQLIQNAGSTLEIHSGSHLLQYKENGINVSEASKWEGTIVFFELYADKVIDHKQIFAASADVEEGYEQLFGEDDRLGDLW